MVQAYPIQFGKYLLLERVAVGGMAEVYRAIFRTIEGVEKVVAVKRILPEFSVDEEFVSLFIDEARISATLQHANIVQVFDFGKTDRSYYIAMEYVDGPNLKNFSQRLYQEQDQFPIEFAIYIIIQLLKALDYLYRAKDPSNRPLFVIHRDISPQNIVLSREGEVKITDFGIAKAASKLSKTQPGKIQGKFGYMSPEQALGKELDHRSDLFSLGIIFYEMLTGRRVYGGENTLVRFENVKEARIEPPSKFRDISPALDRIIVKMLAKNADDRYQTSNDLQKDLVDYLYPANAETVISGLAEAINRYFPRQDYHPDAHNNPNPVAARDAEEQKTKRDVHGLARFWRRKKSSKEPVDIAPTLTSQRDRLSNQKEDGSNSSATKPKSNIIDLPGDEKTSRRSGSGAVIELSGFSKSGRTSSGSGLSRLVTRVLFGCLLVLGSIFALQLTGVKIPLEDWFRSGPSRAELELELQKLRDERKKSETSTTQNQSEMEKMQKTQLDLLEENRALQNRLLISDDKLKELEEVFNREQNKWETERRSSLGQMEGMRLALTEANAKCPKEMISVKPGSFIFGSAEDDSERNLGEAIASMISMKGFCVDTYEFPNNKGVMPKFGMTLAEAQQSCEAVGKRLCSEREWERACKGNQSSRYSYGQNWLEGSCNTENKRGEDGKLNESGAFPKCGNDFKIFDMSGNLSEWTDTLGQTALGNGVVKGGSYDRSGYWSRCAARLETPIDRKVSSIGFRCCKDLR